MLWIDAICINQTDNEEKSIQVRKMGSIYHKARRVVVWLGPSSEHSQRAVDALAHLGRQVLWDPGCVTVFQARECEPDCKEWYNGDHALHYDVDTWSGIADLLNRPWFSRVWIWQEIWLANQSTSILLSGSAEISWSAFKNSMMCMVLKQSHGSQAELSGTALESYFNRVQMLVFHDNPQRTVLELLYDMRNISFCDDPRDRLYALLDLARDSQEVKFEPDYNKPFSQVYYEYCAENVRQFEGSSSSLLFLASCELDSWEEGPTWVPNWSKPLLRGSFANPPSAQAGSYRGPCELIDGLILRVKAVRCGIVLSCSSPAPADISTGTFSSLIQDWLSGISESLILDRILAVLMDGQFKSRTEETPTFEEARRFLELCMKASPATPSNEYFQSGFPLVLVFLRKFLPGRCLFQTTNARWGLGPPSTQPGDIVFSIIGCDILMVLRKNERENFILVGMCSLEGQADMEALLGPLPPGYHVEEGANRWPYDMHFVDTDAGIKTNVDPRLGPSHPGWITKNSENDRIIWHNIESDERTWFDPRHSDINFLQSRGVKIESIDIV